MAQNGQYSLMFRKLSYYTDIMGVVSRTLDHRVISPSFIPAQVQMKQAAAPRPPCELCSEPTMQRANYAASELCSEPTMQRANYAASELYSERAKQGGAQLQAVAACTACRLPLFCQVRGALRSFDTRRLQTCSCCASEPKPEPSPKPHRSRSCR